MIDANKTEQKPVVKTKKDYIGRTSILKMVLERSESTQRYVMVKLIEKFKRRGEAETRLRKLAKSMGVKVAKLELK